MTMMMMMMMMWQLTYVVFISTPKNGGKMNPFWLLSYFSDGLVQPPTSQLLIVPSCREGWCHRFSRSKVVMGARPMYKNGPTWKSCPNWLKISFVHRLFFPYLRIQYSGTVRTGKTRTSCSYSAYKQKGTVLWIRNVFGPFRFTLRKSLADPFIRLCEIWDPFRDHQKQTIQGKLKFDSFLRYTIKFQIGRERSAVPCPNQNGRSVESVGNVDGWNLANQLRFGVSCFSLFTWF